MPDPVMRWQGPRDPHMSHCTTVPSGPARLPRHNRRTLNEACARARRRPHEDAVGTTRWLRIVGGGRADGQIPGWRRRGDLRRQGGSTISGADFALAVVDEIDNPTHRRADIGIAY